MERTVTIWRDQVFSMWPSWMGWRGKGGHSARRVLAVAICLFLVGSGFAPGIGSAALPQNGAITDGSGTIGSGTDPSGHLTIEQSSDRMIINWESFSIGEGNTVQFNQTSGANAVVLNRVVGDGSGTLASSEILGSLTAPGQVFLLNPQGIIFGVNAQIDVGGLVASSLALSEDAFMRADYRFTDGDGAGSVVNEGMIQALGAGGGAGGGYVALIAPQVTNEGTITAYLGTVAMTAGGEVTLDVLGDGLVRVEIDADVAGATVINAAGGSLESTGGLVLLNASRTTGTGSSPTVLAQQGEIRATTAVSRDGRIILSGGSTGDVEIAGSGGMQATGDIRVEAGEHIRVAGENVIRGTGDGDLVLRADAQGAGIGTVTFSGPAPAIDFSGSSGDVEILYNPDTGGGHKYGNESDHSDHVTLGSGGLTSYMLVNDSDDLQNMNENLGGTYALGRDIDATVTSTWEEDGIVRGFNPIGSQANRFAGTFDGRGRTIFGLTIDRQGSDDQGLFGSVGGATIRNVGLLDVSVRGRNNVGSFVGHLGSSGTIESAYATGTVTGGQFVGGLVGYNWGTITSAYATGDVTGLRGVGGLVGINFTGTITSAYATGDVTGSQENVGGLAGVNGNNGTIASAYATGEVRGRNNVGGLAGSNSGTIEAAYATGDVTGARENVGGLVGINSGTIETTYATGQVSGTADVGGLVGKNEDSAGTINRSFYATTDANGNSINNGGNTAEEYSGNSHGAAKTWGQLQQLDTFDLFAGWDISAVGGENTVWRIYDGHTAPLLRIFLTPLEVLPQYDGTGAHLDLIADVATPAGGVLGTATDSTLTLSGSTNAGEYLATVDIAGLYSHQQGYDLMGGTRVISDSNVVNAGDVSLSNGVSWDSGTLRIDAAGDVTSGAIAGGADSVFDLVGGNWQQNSSTLPGFVVEDFRLSADSATFLRVLGGDGTTAEPYRLTDVYGLQGLASHSLLTGHFVLANDIDASVTEMWNRDGSGFRGFNPIGDEHNHFVGTFDGRGHVIGGLYVRRAGMNYQGLFGRVGQAGMIRNVGVADVDIWGQSWVGGLIGHNAGTVTNAYVSGRITGSSTYVGGLVGNNEGGTITYSYATGTVNGYNYVGGLVGINALGGTFAHSYASSGVNGSLHTGGLIGGTQGQQNVTASYWNTTLSGLDESAGGIGITTEQMQSAAFWATQAGWADEVDATGSADRVNTVWRLYDGHTAPLLRSFLTPLELLPQYDGTGAHLDLIGDVAAPAEGVLGILTDNTLTLSGSAHTGEYLATANIGGLYSHQQGYDLIAGTRVISDSNVIDAGDVSLSNGVSWDRGTLRIDASGDVTSVAIVGGSGSGFDLVSGDWQQNNPTLPDFVVEDFRLSPDSATFLRVLGGDGTADEPYRLTDVYGLQGMASHSLLAQNFALAYNIDARVTSSWHGGQGFLSIGDNSTSHAFVGTFDGSGYVVDGLTIDRPGENYIGLFGYVGNRGVVRNVGLTDIDIAGWYQVGGLVGWNSGSISQVYSTGSVRGNENVGGLVGSNNLFGRIRQAYSTSSVQGNNNVGGLVGLNQPSFSQSESITQTYSTGSVQGNNNVGGLVGSDLLRKVTQSFYATTDADGQSINNNGNTEQGYSGNSLGTAKTWDELQQLNTFSGWDISSVGGENTVWRIYDGYTMPLLRTFLKTVTVTASDEQKEYDGLAFSGGSHTISEPGAALLGTAHYNDALRTNAGTYERRVGGLYSDQRGYDIVFEEGTLTITPRPITVSADDMSKVYGELDLTDLTYTITEGTLVGSDKLTGELAPSGNDAGVQTIGQGDLTNANNGNYDITFVDGTLTITPRPITVTADDLSKVYGDDDPVRFTYTVGGDGLVGNDELVGDLTRSSGDDAGAYTIGQGDLTNGNYDITFENGTFTITPRPITVSADDLSKVYGDDDPVRFTYTVGGDGLVGNDELVGDLSRSSGNDAGVHAIGQGDLTNANNSNYDITFVDGTLTITPRPITVAADDLSKVYGDPTELTYTIIAGNLVGSDKLTGKLAPSGNDAGVHAIGQGDLTNANNSNYDITFVGGTLTIDPALLRIIVEDTDRFYGQPNPEFRVIYDGFARGDDEDTLLGTLMIVTDADVTSSPGSYTVRAEGVTSDNYTVAFVPGTLLIQGGFGNLDWIGDLLHPYMAALSAALGSISDVDISCLGRTDDGGHDHEACALSSLFPAEDDRAEGM